MRFVFRSTQLMNTVFRNRNSILTNLTEVQSKVGIVQPEQSGNKYKLTVNFSALRIQAIGIESIKTVLQQYQYLR